MVQDKNKTNIKAIMSLILSCLSLVCCAQWQITMVVAMLSIVLGILGLRDDNPNQHDAAIAGIVVGAVALLVAIVLAVLLIIMSKNASEQGLETMSMIMDSIQC